MEGHGVKEEEEEGKEIELYNVACPDLPTGWKAKFCINEKVAREKFVTAVVDDPTLSLNREEATKIFYKMVELEQKLGLELGPSDLKDQLTLGCEKEDEKDEEDRKEEKEANTEEEKEANTEEEKEDKNKEGPSSSKVEPWIEKMYEEWDSSEDSTVIPSWAASSQDLEEKLANTAPEDYMNVAAMHEIKAEKKARRDQKKVKGNEDEKAGSDGFT